MRGGRGGHIRGARDVAVTHPDVEEEGGHGIDSAGAVDRFRTDELWTYQIWRIS
jgi:hypothetical protein